MTACDPLIIAILRHYHYIWARDTWNPNSLRQFIPHFLCVFVRCGKLGKTFNKNECTLQTFVTPIVFSLIERLVSCDYLS